MGSVTKQDVQRGPYQTADEFVEHVISLLHEQESWLAEPGSEVRSQISHLCGCQRGELIDMDEIRESVDEKKRSLACTLAPVKVPLRGSISAIDRPNSAPAG
jgi:hypothetical protein